MLAERRQFELIFLLLYIKKMGDIFNYANTLFTRAVQNAELI